MARRKSSMSIAPPLATSEVAEPALDNAAERLAKFKAMRSELHAEKVYTAAPKVAPSASVPTQSPAEKRAAEEKARQDAILAGQKAGSSGRRLDWVVDRIKLPQQQQQGPAPAVLAKEFFGAPPTTGLMGQTVAPRIQPTEYETLSATLKYDVECGDVELEDARMILRAYLDLGMPLKMALKSEPAVVRAWISAHPAREATQDSVAIAKGRLHDDRLLDALQKETGKVARPSEKAVLWRICLHDNRFIEGFVEPGPGESRAAAQKRAETQVVNFLLTPPSGTLASTPKKGAPAGPYGDLGLAPDGTERNAARPAPENIAFAPKWGEVRSEAGWERVTRQQILAVRVKGASELDVGRKTRIGGNQATTTPSKPRPLSEPWMKASQDRGTDPRIASAPPRSISRRVDKARRYVDSAARAEVSTRWDYSNPGPLNK